MSEEIQKVIVVDKCDNCPFMGVCDPWKALSSKDRVSLTIGNRYKNGFILKGCPLPDNGSTQVFGAPLNI